MSGSRRGYTQEDSRREADATRREQSEAWHSARDDARKTSEIQDRDGTYCGGERDDRWENSNNRDGR